MIVALSVATALAFNVALPTPSRMMVRPAAANLRMQEAAEEPAAEATPAPAPAPAPEPEPAPVAAPAVAMASAVAFENEINPGPQGVFDPLGLVKDGDQAKFDRLRYVEIKHGRISMLAILGHVVTSAGIRFPGNLATGLPFSSVPTGIKALSVVPPLGWAQMFLFIGALELGVMKDVEGKGEFPGDFRNGFIDFGWDDFTEEEKASKRGIELNNGRAAQMGILALMVHEMLNNDPYVINSLLGAPVPFNVGF